MMLTGADVAGSLGHWRGVIMGQLGAILDRAIAFGEDAALTADRFRAYATAPFAPRRNAAGVPVRLAASALPDVYPARPGMASAGARLLLRIGIGDAHREGVRTAASATNRGVLWIVGDHVAPDACDTIADHDSGYGPGVYLPDRVPSPPHAGCLCSQVVVDL